MSEREVRGVLEEGRKVRRIMEQMAKGRSDGKGVVALRGGTQLNLWEGRKCSFQDKVYKQPPRSMLKGTCFNKS